MLLQGTFGPTNADITSVLNTVGKGGQNERTAPTIDTETTTAAAWVEAQMTLSPTLLRPKYRRSANPRIYHDSSSGGAAEPCEVGSRWNRFAFDSADIGKVLEVVSVPSLQKFRLSIDNVVRTETDNFISEKWPGLAPTTITNNGGPLCLGTATSATANRNPIDMTDCSNTDAQWLWNPSTKLVKMANLNYCLDNLGGNTRVWIYDCNPTNANQQWFYDESTRMLTTNRGACLSAPDTTTTGTVVTQSACDPVRDRRVLPTSAVFARGMVVGAHAVLSHYGRTSNHTA
jgi:hypothetical protein